MLEIMASIAAFFWRAMSAYIAALNLLIDTLGISSPLLFSFYSCG